MKLRAQRAMNGPARSQQDTRMCIAGLLSPEKDGGPALDQDGFVDYRVVHGECASPSMAACMLYPSGVNWLDLTWSAAVPDVG